MIISPTGIDVTLRGVFGRVGATFKLSQWLESYLEAGTESKLSHQRASEQAWGREDSHTGSCQK